MIAKGASTKMLGSKFMPFVSAVSKAVCQYMAMAPIAMSTNVVLGPGAGTYMAKIVGCVPVAMSSMMLVKAASTMTVGKDTKKLFDAVSFGVCNTLLTTAMSQGTVVGGGPGAGQGKILNLIPTVLTGLIMANLAGSKLFGSKTMQIVSAIAFGVCIHIMSAGTLVTTCIGAAAPPPAGPVPVPGAPGFGKLI
jgi:hypothetical protein